MAEDTLHSGVYAHTSRVSPGGAVFEEILRKLRSEKEVVDKKFDAAIAAVTALVPQDVEVRVNFQVAAADVPAHEAEMKADEKVREELLKERVVDYLARRREPAVSVRSLREILRVGEAALSVAIYNLAEEEKIVQYTRVSRGKTGTADMIRLRSRQPQLAKRPRRGKSKSMSDSQKAVFKVVSRRASTPSTIKAITSATKLKRDHVIVILSEITRRGLIKRVGRGLYTRG